MRLGANYPAAIWRPVGPTFMVLAINVFARDPLLSYQLLAGLALATFVTSTYLLNRRLFGHLLAHAGGALAFMTPLVSVVFDQSCAFDLALVLFAGGEPNLARVGRLHSVCARQQADCAMDVGGFGWLGVLLSVPSGKRADGGVLLRRDRRLSQSGEGRLCPSFSLWPSSSLSFRHLTSGPARTLRATISGRARRSICSTPARDGRRFSSQVIEERREPADHDSAGFARAIQLYGKPAENSENLLYAIARNPAAFVARIGAKLKQCRPDGERRAFRLRCFC